MVETIYNSRNPIIQDLNQAVALIQRHSESIKSLSGDARLKDLPDRLEKAYAEIDAVRNAIFYAKDGDRRQAESRGMPQLVGVRESRVLKIQPELDGMMRDFQHQQKRHEEQVNILRNKGFTDEQIATLVESPDEQRYREKVNLLKQEQSKLEAFTRDFPRYDQSLLIGTRFEHWTPETHQDYLPLQVG
jgi:hypothetical protein